MKTHFRQESRRDVFGSVEATDGVPDEQFVRNVVDVLFINRVWRRATVWRSKGATVRRGDGDGDGARVDGDGATV